MAITRTHKIIMAIIASIVLLTAVIVPTVVLTVKKNSSPVDHRDASFYVVPLGTDGGLDESDLSSYLLTPVNDGQINLTSIVLDGGTIRHGIDIAIEKNLLSPSKDTETFIRNYIKAYLISHGHLDHCSGFILNTPNDQAGKYIVALNETINIIQKHYFNNQAWADFGPAGLKTYDYQILDPSTDISVPITNTDFNVRIFRLCHVCPYLSSAFLISRRTAPEASVLYLGDTGPDDVEKITLANNETYSPRYLDQLWSAVRPLVTNNQLKAIFIEVSYANGRSDNLLFGHLTPAWLLQELRVLSQNRSMTNVKILITHIKPEIGAREQIIDQLKQGGAADFTFLFPEQGEPIWL